MLPRVAPTKTVLGDCDLLAICDTGPPLEILVITTVGPSMVELGDTSNIFSENWGVFYDEMIRTVIESNLHCAI